MPDEFVPLYELAVGLKPTWPVNQEGYKIGVLVVRKSSRATVFSVPIDPYSVRGTADALRIARYFVRTHNDRLTKLRREQARNRVTRLKLIKEKHHVNAA